MKNLRWGQTVLEYAILVAVVSAAIGTMAMYVRRAVQGRIYQIEDQAQGSQNRTSGWRYY